MRYLIIIKVKEPVEENYKKGMEIRGLDSPEIPAQAHVIHAGTKKEQGKISRQRKPKILVPIDSSEVSNLVVRRTGQFFNFWRVGLLGCVDELYLQKPVALLLQ